MLVLSRKVGEVITIDDRISVEIVKCAGGRVKIGITAPPEVRIQRGELELELCGHSSHDACQISSQNL